MTDPVTAPAAEPATAPVKPAPIPLVLPPACFADPSKVVRTVPLQFPVVFAGRTWSGIGIRRLSVEQIEAVFANYRVNIEQDPGFVFRMPVYVDETGAELPDGLLGKLDRDDLDDVEEAVADFLPRRYRVPTGLSKSAPSTGAATGPSSSA